MDSENLSVLNQLISSLEEAFEKLEKVYSEKNVDEFNDVKKFILKIQREIEKMLE